MIFVTIWQVPRLRPRAARSLLRSFSIQLLLPLPAQFQGMGLRPGQSGLGACRHRQYQFKSIASWPWHQWSMPTCRAAWPYTQTPSASGPHPGSLLHPHQGYLLSVAALQWVSKKYCHRGLLPAQALPPAPPPRADAGPQQSGICHQPLTASHRPALHSDWLVLSCSPLTDCG